MSEGKRVQSYRDLIVWQKSIELVKHVYSLTQKFPKHETYGLADQLRRCSVSVPSNIAEGQARQHTGEFRHFLYIALGSISEVDTQIIIAEQLGYIATEEARQLEGQIVELKKMLRALIARLPNH
jgi:four helix bundle protein